MPGPLTLAERYRRHRAAFELALELGITPRAAEAMLRRREARAAREAIARCGTAAVPDAGDLTTAEAPTTDYRRWDASWMQRD